MQWQWVNTNHLKCASIEGLEYEAVIDVIDRHLTTQVGWYEFA